MPVVNRTAELADCRDRWTFDAKYGCWCLEDVLYTQRADVPKFQRLSIFVPAAYLNADGTPNPQGRMGRYTAQSVPVVLQNVYVFPAACTTSVRSVLLTEIFSGSVVGSRIVVLFAGCSVHVYSSSPLLSITVSSRASALSSLGMGISPCA